MPKNNKILDDLSKIASSSFSTLMNIKDEVSNMVKDQIRSHMKSMDFVTRSEFNALKKVVMQQNPEAFKKAEKKSPPKKKPVTKKASPKKKTAKK